MVSLQYGYLGFYWQDRAQTLNDYLLFCAKFFQVLSSNFPGLRDVAIATKSGNLAVEVPTTGQDFFALAEKILSPKVKYEYREGDSNILQAKSPLGFTSTWTFSLASGESGSVTISAGSFSDASPGNSIVLKFSHWDSLVSQGVLEKIWLDNIFLSECEFAVFSSTKLHKIIDPEFHYNFAVGWLSYVANYDGLDLKKLPAGLDVKKMTSGLVLKTTKDKLCSFDEKLLDGLKVVQALLVDSGVVDIDDF